MPKAVSNLSAPSVYHNLPVGEIVDRLGGVKAAIADLQSREKALRDELLFQCQRNLSATPATCRTTSAAISLSVAERRSKLAVQEQRRTGRRGVNASSNQPSGKRSAQAGIRALRVCVNMTLFFGFGGHLLVITGDGF